MLLTTKGKYGLKAVFNIVLNGSEPLSLKTISQREGISESYLEILAATLKKNNILLSTRGAKGGYVLARKPSEITVGEMLRALEGSMAPAECVQDDRKGHKSCNGEPECIRTCAIHGALMKLNERINNVLDSMTLQDMLDDYKCGKM